MRNEPVTLTMLIVALLNLLVHWLDLPVLDTDTTEGIANLVLILIGAWIARGKVMPVETVRDAGLSPTVVRSRAANPLFQRHNGE